MARCALSAVGGVENGLSTAVQVGCCFSVYLVVWVFGTFAWLAWLIHIDRTIRALARSWQLDDGVVAFGLWVIPNLLALALYVRWVGKAAHAARYANR